MNLNDLINGVQPEESQGGALPTGNYNVRIEKVDGVTTKAGGKALKLQMRVFGEKYNNACLFDFINIAHPTSTRAVEIGLRRVAKIAQLTGAAETSEWVGKELAVFAKKETSTEYGESNRVGAYNEYVIDTTPASSNTSTSSSMTSDDIPF